jgi:hypothetical protein
MLLALRRDSRSKIVPQGDCSYCCGTLTFTALLAAPPKALGSRSPRQSQSTGAITTCAIPAAKFYGCMLMGKTATSKRRVVLV